MDRSQQLGQGKISFLLLRFSIPAIIGMWVNALYNVVDRIYIGHGVGSLGIAGITIGFPIMLVMMAFSMLIGIGGNSLVSIRLGQKRKDDAELILGNALVLFVGVGLAIGILGLVFLNPLLKLFGASQAVLPYARDYMSIILLGSVFQAIGMGMNNFIRGEGNPKMAMATMLIGAFLNTILDPIFIFVFNLGIKGAALATIISQAVSAIWVLLYFIRGKSILKIRIANLKLQSPIIARIVAVGSAPFAMQIAASILNIILNNSLAFYGGDISISAMGIVNSITMFVLMPIFGINQGAQPIIGYNYGARMYDRVKHTLKLAILAATCIVITGFIAFNLIPEPMVRLFSGNDRELTQLGVKALRIFTLMFPIIGFQIASSNYFQAVGKPRQAMFLSLSRQVLLLIPAVLILPRFWGLTGIMISGPVSDFGSAVVTAIFLYYELKNLDDKHQVTLIPSTSTEE